MTGASVYKRRKLFQTKEGEKQEERRDFRV